MKKVFLFFVLLSALFLLGCKVEEPVKVIEKEEVVEEPLQEAEKDVEEAEVKEEVIEEPKVEEKPKEVEKPKVEEVVDSCGDGKCTYEESICDETTYTTICLKDCKATCPAKLVMIDDPRSNKDLLESYFCGDERCKEVSSNNFELTGSSVVKTIIKNVGEIASPMVVPALDCGNKGRARISIKFTGENIMTSDAKAVIIDWIPPRSQENNYVFLNIITDLSNVEEQTIVDCEIEITARGISAEVQKIRLNMRQFLG